MPPADQSNNQVYQSGNSNPTITYRTPTGQTMTGPLSSAPPQVQLLYQQLPQAQAQTSTAVSGATTAGVGAKAATQPLDLKTSLSKGMTLKDALSTYSSLMKPDDVFKQYLAQSPYGLPNENPTELQNMGVSPDALGKIGDPGSFMDRYNTKNAISELRGLEDTFNKVSGLGKTPVIGELFHKAYNAQKLAVADHLSSLIPGASQGQGSNKSFQDSLPDPSNPTDVSQAHDIFNKIESPLLQSKGYTPQQLGLPPKPQPKPSSKPTSGGDLLNTILGNAGKNVADDVTGMANANYTLNDLLTPGAIQKKAEANNPLNLVMGMSKQYGDLISNPGKSFKDNPVNSALAVAGPLSYIFGGEGAEAAAAEGEGGAAETISKPNIKVPGSIKTNINPQSSMDAGNALKDNAVNAIDKGGSEISGQNIVNSIKGQMPLLKKAFSGVTAKDVEEITTELEGDFKGNISAKDAQTIYNKIPDSYTSTGVPKQDFNSALNKIKKEAISSEIEKTAPGQGWQDGVDAQRRSFVAQKGQVAQIKKNIVPRAISAGLGIAGLDTVRHVLGL